MREPLLRLLYRSLLQFSSPAQEGEGDTEMMSASIMSQFTQSLLLFVSTFLYVCIILLLTLSTPVSDSVRAKIHPAFDSLLQQSAANGTHGPYH